MADTDPDALERDIERTRVELARTVDAIADRVSPRRVAERGVTKVKTNAEQLVATVGDMVADATQRAGAALSSGKLDQDIEDIEGGGSERRAQSIAPILIGVGAVLVVGAAILLLRRRRK